MRRFAAWSLASQAVALLAMTATGDTAVLLAACAVFGLSAGNLLTLPSLVIQREFEAASFGMLVGLSWAISQFTYAFGPGLLGVHPRRRPAATPRRSRSASALDVAAAALILLRPAAAATRYLSSAGGLQIIVGLDDLAQLVFGGAVAAVGVGMMALHQHLEARLDLGLVGADFEAELIQRLALGVAHGARRLGLLGLRRRAAELAEHVERIARGVGAELGPGMIAGAHLPGRAMAGDGVLLVLQTASSLMPEKKL